MTYSPATSSSESGDRPGRFLLVTGCYRSGTTLLEKLLHNHPDVCLASQPFPELYYYVKQRFLERKKLARRYPLDHLFLEGDYAPADLVEFLDRCHLRQQDIDEVFRRLRRCRLGLWTPETLQLHDAVEPGTFVDLFRRMLRLLAFELNCREPRRLGAKEILCEEFTPFLLQKGIRTIVIIRDPRDMVTSLSFRDRDNLTGDPRPLLYSLRVWRKSVAYALAFEQDPDFLWIRYEDLIAEPVTVMNRIARFLKVSAYPDDAFAGEILGQDGRPWRGNSSFLDKHSVSASSRGVFADRLPREAVSYIELVCRPEMAALGYDTHEQDRPSPEILSRFREPFEKIHERFPADYSYSARRVAQELDRIELLGRPTPLDPEAARVWFLDERAYRRLRQTNPT